MIALAVTLALVALAVIALGVCVALAPDHDQVTLESRDTKSGGGWIRRPIRSDPRRLAGLAFRH
jgi:hypothetical protein